jgi:hypothetical protein
MSLKREAGSQAGWALITGQVSDARVDAHRLHQLIHKVLALVNSSKEKEHLYQVAGDMVHAIPERLEKLEQRLDNLSYALSIMGKEHLRERLPVADRALIESTIEGSPAFRSPMLHESSKRVHLIKRVADKYCAKK